MSCEAWHDSLTGRLYGEIEAEDDAALAAHLASCADCRKTLDDFDRVRSMLRDDASETPRVPRVVVLQNRFRLRPALMAASILGAAILAGAGAGAGYALGSGRSAAREAVPAESSLTSQAATEELVRREVDRRLAALEQSRPIAAAVPAAERPLTASELKSEFAKFERRLNNARATDLDFMLDQIAASEFRVGARLGKTNDALRTVALANTSYLNEQ